MYACDVCVCYVCLCDESLCLVLMMSVCATSDYDVF